MVNAARRRELVCFSIAGVLLWALAAASGCACMNGRCPRPSSSGATNRILLPAPDAAATRVVVSPALDAAKAEPSSHGT